MSSCFFQMMLTEFAPPKAMRRNTHHPKCHKPETPLQTFRVELLGSKSPPLPLLPPSFQSRCQMSFLSKSTGNEGETVTDADYAAPHPIIQFLFLSPNTIVKRQFQSQVSVILTRQTAVLSCTPLRGWRFSNWFVSWKGVPLRFSPFKLQQST